MNKRKLLATAIILASGASALGARISVDAIEPPHWWVGMNDSTLQLQIHGKNIRNARFSIDGEGVRLDSVARLDGSHDWQYVYLTVSPDAKPGKVKMEWRDGKDVVKRNFELRARTPRRGAKGFSSADVMYLIMPDRFADGDPSNNRVASMRNPVGADRSNLNVRHGGDLKGMSDHIDYIDSLGVTAVWVNPVLENDMPDGSYHGYATTDYYRIDPRFGSNEDYTRLISDLHDRDIKTVMDMIFNHCGIAHPWIAAPPASDWFNFQNDYHQTNYRLSTITDPYSSDYDRKITTDGWFVYGMPDLNQRNPHLMKYLVQNSIWWIEESDIDGIRMDTYPYADYAEMGKWIDAVKSEYPDFQIVGECWFGEPAGEQFWQSGSAISRAKGIDTRLPVVMDFPLMIKSRDMKPFRDATDPWNGLNTIYDHLALDYVYENPDKVLRFLDNHDTERFILEVPEDLSQWKQAITLLLTIPGIPQLYYGTELLMAGDRKPGDGNVRRDVPGGFPGDSVNNFTRSGRTDLQNEAYDYIAAVNKWRKGNKAVASGKMLHFMPDNGIYLYRRGEGDDAVFVVMNGNDEPLEVDMSRYMEVINPGEKFTDVITGEEVELIPAGDSRMREFAPRETRILSRKS